MNCVSYLPLFLFRYLFFRLNINSALDCMIVVIREMRHFKSLDVFCICSFVHHSVWTTQEVFLLAMEETRHWAHKRKLKSSISVKSICIRYPNPEILLNTHFFYLWNKGVSISIHFFVKILELDRHFGDLVARHNTRVTLLPLLACLISGCHLLRSGIRTSRCSRLFGIISTSSNFDHFLV